MDNFDFVVVGAGTAGCALAYRLSEAGHSVCVLEAGPPDSNPLIHIPSGIMKTSNNRRLTWHYEMIGNENTKNRTLPIFFGKTLGGSSSLNGMIYNRGQRIDFDTWAKAGNDGWNFDAVLPYFRKSERFLDGGDDQYRGRLGPIPISLLKTTDALSDKFIEGAVEKGIPKLQDYNSGDQEGVSYVQGTIHKGRRVSSATAYLHPARRKFNVDIRTDSLVRRILIEDQEAVGVEYYANGSNEVRTARARLSTIVSAGAAMSPRLLQLSGLGPRKLLSDFNIPIVRDLKGTGENLSDHYAARLVARVKPGFGTINERAHGVPLLVGVAKWLLGKPSILALNAMSVFTFCKSDAAAKSPDYSLMFLPASLKGGMTRQLDSFPGVTGGAWQQRPESRGYVRIKSGDVRDAPLIYPNYLDAEIDRRVLVGAMRHLREVFRSKAMTSMVTEIVLPANECETDDEWLDYVRGSGMTCYHFAGTCKMGPASDPLAVVDSRLRVHGLGRLRVIDASIMPTQPSGNTNASAMMIGEKGAQMVLEDVANLSAA